MLTFRILGYTGDLDELKKEILKYYLGEITDITFGDRSNKLVTYVTLTGDNLKSGMLDRVADIAQSMSSDFVLILR